MPELREFSEWELREELRRRHEVAAENARNAFRCQRCGAVGAFIGDWTAGRWMQQHQAFFEQHKTCPLAIDGGEI